MLLLYRYAKLWAALKAVTALPLLAHLHLFSKGEGVTKSSRNFRVRVTVEIFVKYLRVDCHS